ncbi:MAG TPA: OmpA family protein [Bacteroidia bacterium]|nr:OmpA family protein [Bacteroidia bacterium]
MKNNSRGKIIFVIGCFFTFITGCLSVKLRTANSYYDDYAFADAIKNYEAVLEKKYNPDAIIKLADCYRQTNNSLKAEQWYSEVVKLPNTLPEYKLYYAEALMENTKYAEAKKWFTEYLLLVSNDEKAKRKLASCDTVQIFFQDTTEYNISLLPINLTGVSSFSPVFYRSGIVFLSDRTAPGKSNMRSDFTGKPFLDLFYAKKSDKGNWLEPEMLRGDINGLYNEGPAAFSKDFNSVYFTRNDYTGFVANKNKKNFNLLKIYKGNFISGEWNLTSEMPFNSNEYSCGHPTISSSGSKMFFVSDMPWGYGGTDIYMVTWENQKWSNFQNLGPRVNSPGNEMFPFLLNDSTLYFASDGNYGLGGLDVFMTTYDGDLWSTPSNLGYPVNTSHDDFSFIMDSTERFGYFSSDRVGGVDKIFSFTKNPPKITVAGIIMDKLTSLPLGKTKVYLKDLLDKDSSRTATTANDGKYILSLEQNRNYRISVGKNGYYSTFTSLATSGLRSSHAFNVDFRLEKINVGKSAISYSMLFPRYDWKINASCALALDSVVNWLKDNPGIMIEISCHTDSRGNDKDNLVLTQKRAEEISNFLSRKGISSRRLTAKGLGETRLLNGCVNGILCIEEDHRVNNRTEIKITGLDPQ